MFDGSLRDKLLFEDQSFTYSRRYFWAYQTLGIMMNSIKSILDAYYSTFTSEVWEGKHRSLWPMVEEDSARNVYWRKRMMGLKKDFEKQIKRLNRLYEDNDDRRKEIRTLRDQLFSGTSVLESRKSVELSEVTILQGHNIKLLTLVSTHHNSPFLSFSLKPANLLTDNQTRSCCVTGINLLSSLNICDLCLWHVEHATEGRIWCLRNRHVHRLHTVLLAHWVIEYYTGDAVLAEQMASGSELGNEKKQTRWQWKN